MDEARRKKTQKRGDDSERVELGEVAAPNTDDELLALDEAPTRLAALDARIARFVASGLPIAGWGV
jgi:hypothetical protein